MPSRHCSGFIVGSGVSSLFPLLLSISSPSHHPALCLSFTTLSLTPSSSHYCSAALWSKKRKKHQPQAFVKGRAPFCRNTQMHTWLHIWLRPLIFALPVFACLFSHALVNKRLCPACSIPEFAYSQIVGAEYNRKTYLKRNRCSDTSSRGP